MNFKNLRIGHGYDVHKLIENKKLILGGILINYHLGLDGHSDADVLVHAIIDALLGASGLPDIGCFFPDSNMKYKNISSLKLLTEINKKIKKNYKIINIDCTIIAQSPKLNKYINIIRENLTKIIGISFDKLNIKSTTEEGLGFTGAHLGIACHAIVLIYKKIAWEFNPKQNIIFKNLIKP
ncbi:MAG: 2-C-methyl-D-erythritol 2,4-cyclodiphosphate synthase [Candidatus Improbicoccus devescovinae]|nr:MAG: 2-C-methyl-D-erythritol 2,4-cyclodiphosphate synthase [Candidatus Improbicoccus devescovinae]